MPSIGIQSANGGINAALVVAFPLLSHDLKKKKKKKKNMRSVDCKLNMKWYCPREGRRKVHQDAPSRSLS